MGERDMATVRAPLGESETIRDRLKWAKWKLEAARCRAFRRLV